MFIQFLEKHYTLRNIIHAAFYALLILIAVVVYLNLQIAGENVGSIFIVGILTATGLYLHLTKHAGATVIVIALSIIFAMVIPDWKLISPSQAFYYALMTSLLVALMVTYYSLNQRPDLEQA